MIKVKICGITNLNDALDACSLGADALGFVFVKDSPRYINPADAGEIIKKLPAFVTSVGLFVNASIDEVKKSITRSGVDILQFHGDESEEFCLQFNRRYIKAFQVKSHFNLVECCNNYNSAAALLLDAFSDSARGGTGIIFDWNLIPQDSLKPLIIAGGLNNENISLLINQHQPYAVDVSGGVEITKGKKDFKKMKEFILGVKHASI